MIRSGKRLKQRPIRTALLGLIVWLENQPADKIYCYEDSGRCLAAQYRAAIGEKYIPPGADLSILRLPKSEWPFTDILEDVAVKKPRTFGAALKRARSL
jgi:hypothetical protein